MSSIISNQLESLSNELLIDIFENLDAYNLYQAFHGLNFRIDTLLQSTHLHIVYDLSKQNEQVWDTLKLFFNPLQIRLISSYGNLQIDESFLSAYNTNLCAIRLYEMDRTYTDQIFRHFSNNNQIKCLCVKQKREHNRRKTHSLTDLLLVDHGHRFATLTNLALSLSPVIDDFPVVPVIFSQLRHLSITNCCWAENLLRFFQENTPNLRSLKISTFFYLRNSSSNIIKHIYELHVTGINNFDNVRSVASAFPSLRRLHIDWQYNARYPVTNGSQWQQLIEQYIPHLKQLTIDFGQGIDEDILYTFYTGEFWSTKKVKVKMIINKGESRYRLVKTIYFGKEWHFRYFDDF